MVLFSYLIYTVSDLSVIVQNKNNFQLPISSNAVEMVLGFATLLGQVWSLLI